MVTPTVWTSTSIGLTFCSQIRKHRARTAVLLRALPTAAATALSKWGLCSTSRFTQAASLADLCEAFSCPSRSLARHVESPREGRPRSLFAFIEGKTGQDADVGPESASPLPGLYFQVRTLVSLRLPMRRHQGTEPPMGTGDGDAGAIPDPPQIGDGAGTDPRSPAVRGSGWGWTPDPRQIGDRGS